jgi:hypothetical protein
MRFLQLMPGVQKVSLSGLLFVALLLMMALQAGGATAATLKSNTSRVSEANAIPFNANAEYLREMVHDALFAALPVMPLCQEDCAGLCPTCGINRNTGTCDCTVDVSDPRWAALDTLKGPGPSSA